MQQLTSLLAVSAVIAVTAACGSTASTGLRVSLSNVGWHHSGGSGWSKIGARVDIDCQTHTMSVDANGVERTVQPTVETVCLHVNRNPQLLKSATPHSCDYYPGTVSVIGTWNGRPVRLKFSTCEFKRSGALADDPGAQWAHLLGFHFQGPDAPAQ